MRNLILIFLAIALSACANGPFSNKRDIESSAQQQGQVVACSGYKMWPDCQKAAAHICPNGYDVLAKEESLPTQTRTLRIRCK
jgi:hypothetical protein